MKNCFSLNFSDGTLLAATSNGDPKSQVRFFSLVPEILELDEKHSLRLKVETFPGLFLQSPTLPGTKGEHAFYVISYKITLHIFNAHRDGSFLNLYEFIP
jgi:hypothetical protein